MLRGVDHTELIGQAVSDENLNQALGGDQQAKLGDQNLSELFGIDLDVPTTASAVVNNADKVSRTKTAKPRGTSSTDRSAAKKTTGEKQAVKTEVLATKTAAAPKTARSRNGVGSLKPTRANAASVVEVPAQKLARKSKTATATAAVGATKSRAKTRLVEVTVSADERRTTNRASPPKRLRKAR